MTKNTFIPIIFFLIMIIYSQNLFASKTNFIKELFVFSTDNSVSIIKQKTKKITKTVKKKPKPKKFRNLVNDEFDINFKDKYVAPDKLINQFDNKISQNSEDVLDLNNNGLPDAKILFSDPITSLLDLDENGFFEIEYVFYNLERWIYYDENEDGKSDFLFKDLNGDGINEEVIKIEN